MALGGAGSEADRLKCHRPFLCSLHRWRLPVSLCPLLPPHCFTQYHTLEVAHLQIRRHIIVIVAIKIVVCLIGASCRTFHTHTKCRLTIFTESAFVQFQCAINCLLFDKLRKNNIWYGCHLSRLTFLSEQILIRRPNKQSAVSDWLACDQQWKCSQLFY